VPETPIRRKIREYKNRNNLLEKKQLLLIRLDQIAQSLSRCEHALAIIGLGSAGLELERLDNHSDLDFFVIVEPGYKSQFIHELDWITSVAPTAYYFQNTADGYKLLYADGVFCEFAVFTLEELAEIPFAPGRMVWKRLEVEDQIAIPRRFSAPRLMQGVNWQVGEALTNLYIGLERWQRGEKLSAARFIQGYALDRVLELVEMVEPPRPGLEDPFTRERRFEQRFPGVTRRLPEFVQGYDRSPESALAILKFLERHFPVNPAIAQAVRALCGDL
jgi:lincosamide nucleotidyltransferase B/F